MKQRWSAFRGFQTAFFLARLSGSSFQQPPASFGGGGAGISPSCCVGAVSRYAADSSFDRMAAIMAPARAAGDVAGLGASFRK